MAGRLAGLVLQVAQRASASLLIQAPSQAAQGVSALRPLASCPWSLANQYHTGASAWAEARKAPAPSATSDIAKPEDKLTYLADKDIWDEAWAYEPRFGTEDSPIAVPAMLPERIMGVTDPEDDTLVIWGIIREGEPPKQLVAGGEFFVLKRVERIEKVGDVLGITETSRVEVVTAY